MKHDTTHTHDRAVSPVIGVILMVAITVILAAVIGTFVLDLGQSAGDRAPSASLTVDANANGDFLNVSHKGGDPLDSSQSRVIVTESQSGDSIDLNATASSDSFAVGSEIAIDVANAQVNGSPWETMSDDGSPSLAGLTPGNQYEVQLIDTNSQRVIFETTVTA